DQRLVHCKIQCAPRAVRKAPGRRANGRCVYRCHAAEQRARNEFRKGFEVSSEASTVLADTGALPTAADQWASFLPPFEPTRSRQRDGANIPFIGAQEAASQAVVTATVPWAAINTARFTQRGALAEQFVAACGGAA